MNLFVSFVTQDPGKPVVFGSMVLVHTVPRDDTALTYLQMCIHNRIPEESRPKTFPTILSFQPLSE